MTFVWSLTQISIIDPGNSMENWWIYQFLFIFSPRKKIHKIEAYAFIWPLHQENQSKRNKRMDRKSQSWNKFKMFACHVGIKNRRIAGLSFCVSYFFYCFFGCINCIHFSLFSRQAHFHFKKCQLQSTRPSIQSN